MPDENQYELDIDWAKFRCIKKGIKYTEDQLEDFAERVSIKTMDGMMDDLALDEAFREVFNGGRS